MKFEVIRTSKLSQYGDSLRTTIPIDIVNMFNLENKVIETKRLISFRILKYRNFLILYHEDLVRRKIEKIEEFFEDKVQRYEDITLYINVTKNHYAMGFNSIIIEFLNLETEKLLSYAILDIDEENKYILISGKANIFIEDEEEEGSEKK